MKMRLLRSALLGSKCKQTKRSLAKTNVRFRQTSSEILSHYLMSSVNQRKMMGSRTPVRVVFPHLKNKSKIQPTRSVTSQRRFGAKGSTQMTLRSMRIAIKKLRALQLYQFKKTTKETTTFLTIQVFLSHNVNSVWTCPKTLINLIMILCTYQP